MTFKDPFAQHGHYHPSVNAAIAAREKIDRIEAARERAQEPDLKEAVRELAEIIAEVEPAPHVREKLLEVARRLS